MAHPVIAIRGLKVSLGGREVLRDVNLEIFPGEVVALLGASGSGKSTLLRAAVGLIRPDRGEVEFAGLNPAKSSRAELREARRKVGMVFQQNALFDSMTVAENIGFTLREVLELDEEEIGCRVSALLARLNLGEIGELYPLSLSGGMKKRVAIARAIAPGPSIVLYDDPTAGLDPITSLVIASLIADLRREREQAGIIVSNHLPLVTRTTGRALLLRDGRVHEAGLSASLTRRDAASIGLISGQLAEGAP